MSDMSVIVVSGNIGRDAVTKSVGDGQVTEFSLAVTTGWGDRERTTWYECNYWGKRGATVAKFLTKGTRGVVVSGEPSLRKYTTKDGNEGASLEINVRELTLPPKRAATQDAHNEAKSNGYQPDPNDEIPF